MPPRSKALANWSQPLPRPLTIPGVMTLRTLADMRAFLRRVPKARRELDTWQAVTRRLDAAAAGGDVAAASIALQMVLQLERVPVRIAKCRVK